MKNRIWAVTALALAAVMPMAHAESTPAKKELIAKVLQLQQPVREQLLRQLAQGPVAPMAQQANQVLQFRVPPEKREAAAKDVQATMAKYVEETTTMLREREAKLSPTLLGPALEEKFSEEELKQLVTFLESPVQRKFGQVTGDGIKALSTQLVADTRASLEPKFKAMEQAVSKRLNEAVASAATPPAKPASK